MCFYYFIDHSKQLIFWVHPVNVGDICGIIRGVKNEWQLGYAIETHYWHHCELYPSHIRLKPDFYPKLRGILIYTNGDSMVSDAPPGPFESTDLQRLLDLVSAVGGQVDTYDEYLITVLAKAMRLFYQYRFLNSHGQFGARLGGGRSVFARKRVKELPVSIFLMGANIALFGALIDHYRRIQKIWVDGIVDESRWETYISSLRTEWNNYIVFSTVMLAVDVSFLAVPGVQAASGLQQPVAATMTYASVIFSAMALLAASFLTRQAGQFVRMTENTYETEVLAAMFSLPRAFLNLATYSFVIALISLVISLNNMAALGIMLAIMVIYYSSVNLLLGCIAIIRLFPWCGGQSEATSS
ncbi:hypothetical protein BS17DRAFT_537811 [Gyrodon lividus]|nr:hypothetical protein BS17DRAFT_537811 [Gyrodon lividus]